jgi:hypothetical protein
MKLGFWLRILLLSVAWSAVAHAQAPVPSIVLPSTGVQRTNQADSNFGLNVINRRDCVNDDAFIFSFQLENTRSFTIEAWRGNDCTNDMNREGEVGCKKVAQGVNGTNQMTIPVRNIVAGVISAGIEACDTDVGRDNAQDFTLFFLPLDTNGQIPEGATFAQWPPANAPRGLYDMIGPTPPTDISAGAGEGQIIVTYDASTSTDVTGYRVYCDPPPGQADAGAQTDAGNTACFSNNLVQGSLPPEPEATFRCGNVGSMTETINASNLQDFVQHAVAVAALDRVGNIGVLSDVACATPKPVTGFFEAYRAAGGTAGGGFCALSRRPSPATFAGVLAAAFALAARRRRAR